MSTEFKLILLGIWSLAIAALCWVGGERYAEPSTISATPHTQYRLPAGALVAAVSAAAPVAQQAVPKGAHVAAAFSATIAPQAPVVEDAPGKLLAVAGEPAQIVTTGLIDTCEALLKCPAVTLLGSEVKESNGQQDLVLSTPGGTVQTAVFNPGTEFVAPPAHPWLLGIERGDGHVGLVAGYEFQRLPIDVGVSSLQGETSVWLIGRF